MLSSEETFITDEETEKILQIINLLSNEYTYEQIALVANRAAQAWLESLDCVSCGDNLIDKREMMLLSDQTMLDIGLDPDGNESICVSCAEETLGRELTHFDFKSSMIIYEQELRDHPQISPEERHSLLLQRRLVNGLEDYYK